MLQKQNVQIAFSQGVDLKTDPKQVQTQLLNLENGVFPSILEIQKRNGFSTISSTSSGNALASYNKELVALTGSDLLSQSASTSSLITKGVKYSADISVNSIVKNNYQQQNGDSAIHPSGVSVFAWEDSSGGVRFSIFDTVTQQSIVTNQLLTSTGAKPKVKALGRFVVISFVDTTTSFLNYSSVSTGPVGSPSDPMPLIELDSSLAYDCQTINSERLYYAAADAAGTLSVFFLDEDLNMATPATETVTATAVCIFGDDVNNAWVAYATTTGVGYFIRQYNIYGPPITDSAGANITNNLGEFLYAVASSSTPSTILAPTLLETISNVVNITAIFNGGLGYFYYEIKQSDDTPYDNFVRTTTGSLIGSVGSPQDFYRSVGLASKPFIYNNVVFVTLIHDSDLQPTLFIATNSAGSAITTVTGDLIYTVSGELVTSLFQAPTIIAKLAPSTAGRLLKIALLPEVTPMMFNQFQITYSIRDTLNAISGDVYTQTGINQVILTFNEPTVTSVLGNNLHVSGGILSMYDGASVVEHGYNLYPENAYGTSLATQGGLSTGQYQYAITYEWMDNVGQIHRSAPSVPLTIKNGDTTFFGGTTNTSTDITGAPPGIPENYPITGTGIPANTVTTGYSAPGVLSISNAATATATVLITVSKPVTNQHLMTFTAPDTATFTNELRKNVYGSTVSGSFDLTVLDSRFIEVGMTVEDSPYFAGSPVVLSIAGNVITLDTAASGTVTNDVFYFENGVTGFEAEAILFVGQEVKGSGIVANTFIDSISGNTVTLTTDTNTAVGSTGFYVADPFSVYLALPTLRLTEKDNVNIVVYRTEANGTVFYRTSSVMSPIANNLTVDYVYYQDELPDEELIGNDQLYTTGGEVENIAVPATSSLTTYKNRLIALTEEDPLLFWYSKQVISGTPVEFSDFFTQRIDERDGPLVVLNQMDDKLILFKNNTIWYMVGDGPAPNGTANDFTQPQIITTDCGCINKKSVVAMPKGLMFQSAKGIYLLDRSLQVSYIGAPVDNNFVITSAELIEDVNQVRFTLSNGTIYTYDYFVNQWDTFTNLDAIDSTIFQSQHTFISSDGIVKQETPNIYNDDNGFIPLKLESGWLSLAGIQGFQRVREFLFLGEYESPHSLQVEISYDFEDTVAQTTIIPVLSRPTTAYQYRVFLSRQKCEALKFTITELQTAPYGQGLSLSDFALEVGVKRGLNKMAAAQSYGGA